MTLLELKNFLKRYDNTQDFNDLEVVLQTTSEPTEVGYNYEILSFIGFIDSLENPCIILGGEQTARKLQKQGQLKNLDGKPIKVE